MPFEIWEILRQCCFVACLQTIQEGREAKAITREEFEDILKKVHQKVLQMIAARGENWTPLYSWDHTNLHEKINFQKVGFSEQQRVALGVRAPDMHQVIEHVFGYMKQKFHVKLLQQGYKVPGRRCQQIARDIFYSVVTPQGIAGNVARMPLVYKMISTAKGQFFVHTDNKMYVGTGGNWVTKPWR
jgi:hypothetical protein